MMIAECLLKYAVVQKSVAETELPCAVPPPIRIYMEEDVSTAIPNSILYLLGKDVLV